MRFVQRLRASLRNQGLAATSGKLRAILADHWFDFRYGLDTCSCSELAELTIDSANKSRGYLYQPVRVLPLRRFFCAMGPALPRGSALVDFGSGKGRVLLVASEFGFPVVRGVEFAHELCVTARENCRRFKARRGSAAEFEVIEGDAAKFEISRNDGVFVMCNPFDDSILEAVLSNIRKSVQEFPRPVVIAYYNPKWGGVIERQPDFAPLRELNFWGHKFATFSNRG